MYFIQHCFVLGLRLIMFVTSISLLYIVLFIRKRHEFFYIAVPLAFMISGAIGVFMEVRFLFLDWKVNMDPSAFNVIAIFIALHYMFYTAGHQFFASQYLQTSLTLSIMFTEAKLEWAV